jgi:type VI secretion system protein ImpH
VDGEARQQTDRLSFFEKLTRTPWEFDFFQAMRRIECLFPRFARLGKALRPTEEPVRMAQEASLGFAPSTLASCEQQPKGLPPRLEQRFFGLLGPNGPLPLHLTEHAITRQIHHQDKTFGRFLDVLQHRMLLLFYRAWADAQPTVRADRPAEDRFAFYLGAVAGWSTPHMRGRDTVPDVAKIFFAGHFVRPQRNAEALAAMLSEFFGLPVKVDQFVPSWLELPDDQRSQLGRLGGEALQLGVSVVLGRRVCDVQSRIRIRIGPMNLERYEGFLPGQRNLLALRDWVRDWLGFEFECEVVPMLARKEVAGVRLGQAGKLGWTSWLGAWRKPNDAEDLVLTPERWQHETSTLAAAA